MDPNENLREQLEISARIMHAMETGDYDAEDMEADACRLAELVLALDAWIKSGGFRPGIWSRTGELQ